MNTNDDCPHERVLKCREIYNTLDTLIHTPRAPLFQDLNNYLQKWSHSLQELVEEFDISHETDALRYGAGKTQKEHDVFSVLLEGTSETFDLVQSIIKDEEYHEEYHERIQLLKRRISTHVGATDLLRRWLQSPNAPRHNTDSTDFSEHFIKAEELEARLKSILDNKGQSRGSHSKGKGRELELFVQPVEEVQQSESLGSSQILHSFQRMGNPSLHPYEVRARFAIRGLSEIEKDLRNPSRSLSPEDPGAMFSRVLHCSWVVLSIVQDNQIIHHGVADLLVKLALDCLDHTKRKWPSQTPTLKGNDPDFVIKDPCKLPRHYQSSSRAESRARFESTSQAESINLIPQSILPLHSRITSTDGSSAGNDDFSTIGQNASQLSEDFDVPDDPWSFDLSVSRSTKPELHRNLDLRPSKVTIISPGRGKNKSFYSIEIAKDRLVQAEDLDKFPVEVIPVYAYRERPPYLWFRQNEKKPMYYYYVQQDSILDIIEFQAKITGLEFIGGFTHISNYHLEGKNRSDTKICSNPVVHIWATSAWHEVSRTISSDVRTIRSRLSSSSQVHQVDPIGTPRDELRCYMFGNSSICWFSISDSIKIENLEESQGIGLQITQAKKTGHLKVFVIEGDPNRPAGLPIHGSPPAKSEQKPKQFRYVYMTFPSVAARQVLYDDISKAQQELQNRKSEKSKQRQFKTLPGGYKTTSIWELKRS